jgi:hypothetical protein
MENLIISVQRVAKDSNNFIWQNADSPDEPVFAPSDHDVVIVLDHCVNRPWMSYDSIIAVSKIVPREDVDHTISGTSQHFSIFFHESDGRQIFLEIVAHSVQLFLPQIKDPKVSIVGN